MGAFLHFDRVEAQQPPFQRCFPASVLLSVFSDTLLKT